jgi:sterol 14-demethylase
MMIAGVMQKRRDEGRREEDTLQVLMDSGKSDPEVVQTMLGFFFAAIINTGIGSAWLLLHVANNPIWRAKILQVRLVCASAVCACAVVRVRTRWLSRVLTN